MWRTILVWAIKAAVAAKLPEKILARLKAALVQHFVNLEARVSKHIDEVEARVGPLSPVSCDCEACGEGGCK